MAKRHENPQHLARLVAVRSLTRVHCQTADVGDVIIKKKRRLATPTSFVQHPSPCWASPTIARIPTMARFGILLTQQAFPGSSEERC